AGDARELLQGGGPGTYDVAFLDPPFDPAGGDRLTELCRLLAEGRWLAPGAVVYLERGGGEPEPSLPEGWQTMREKRAGNVRYSLVLAGGGAGQAREEQRCRYPQCIPVRSIPSRSDTRISCAVHCACSTGSWSRSRPTRARRRCSGSRSAWPSRRRCSRRSTASR